MDLLHFCEYCPMALRPLLGLCFLGFFLFLSSKKFSLVSWKKVALLLTSQIFLLILCLKTPMTHFVSRWMEAGIVVLQRAIKEGTSFVFGPLGSGDYPFVLKANGQPPFSFMFQILPSLMVMGALSMMLFHWGALPWLVKRISGIFGPLWRIGGALSTAMAAKFFWGLSEVPLFVKPYLKNFSPNEFLSLMTMGLSTAAVSVFALYYTFLSPHCENAMSFILTATIVNIPCSLWIAEILVPAHFNDLNHEQSTLIKNPEQKDHRGSTEEEKNAPDAISREENQQSEMPFQFNSTLEAIAQGAIQGWTLVTIIGSVTIVFIALVSLGGDIFSGVLNIFSIKSTLKEALGMVFVPLTWLMGLDNQDISNGAQLLAQKILLNEVVALLQITPGFLKPRSLEILIFSLCNFGSLCSVAMQGAILQSFCSERKILLNKLSFLSLWASIAVGFFNGLVMAFLL